VVGHRPLLAEAGAYLGLQALEPVLEVLPRPLDRFVGAAAELRQLVANQRAPATAAVGVEEVRGDASGACAEEQRSDPHGTSLHARSRRPVAPCPCAQCAQQKIRPFASTPCPTTRQPQCAHTGASAWIAHSKLSKTCVFDAARISKLLSYWFPHTSHCAMRPCRLHPATRQSPAPGTTSGHTPRRACSGRDDRPRPASHPPRRARDRRGDRAA